MEFNKEATDWIREEVISNIIGCCCDLSNWAAIKNIPIEAFDPYFTDQKAFKQLAFLLINFEQILDNQIIDEYFSKNNNQWINKKDLFKQFIEMSKKHIKVELRDKRLDILLN